MRCWNCYYIIRSDTYMTKMRARIDDYARNKLLLSLYQYWWLPTIHAGRYLSSLRPAPAVKVDSLLGSYCRFAQKLGPDHYMALVAYEL